jgi:ABC-type hemin transport system substrate-binding protein
LRSTVDQASRAVQARGGRLVLVAADTTDSLTRLGATTAVVGVDEHVREDARLLERRPDHLVELPIQVWLAPVS